MKKLAFHKVLINAPVEHVWSCLVDHEQWHLWDKGMDWVRFDGPLALGSKGAIKLHGGPKCTLVVTEFVEALEYKSEFKLWGSRFEFDHHVEPAANFTLVTFRVAAQGLFADVMHVPMLAKFGENLPQWMNGFKELAEKRSVETV